MHKVQYDCLLAIKQTKTSLKDRILIIMQNLHNPSTLMKVLHLYDVDTICSSNCFSEINKAYYTGVLDS